MEEKQLEQLEALKEIRAMMERSTRFLSLSGLSGIWAGFCALLGVFTMYAWLKVPQLAISYLDTIGANYRWGLSYREAFLAIGLGTLVLTMAGVYFFNARRARQKGHSLWDQAAKRMFFALLIPLAVGAIFCVALARYQMIGLIAPTTILFYGLALLQADQYTIGNIRFLGFLQIFLGCLGLFMPQYGLHLWAMGFGVLHILYGSWIYFRFEHKSPA
jgi:predicted lysophospholipase L1 biosynthesis ABC-type transport system permease subunit